MVQTIYDEFWPKLFFLTKNRLIKRKKCKKYFYFTNTVFCALNVTSLRKKWWKIEKCKNVFNITQNCSKSINYQILLFNWYIEDWILIKCNKFEFWKYFYAKKIIFLVKNNQNYWFLSTFMTITKNAKECKRSNIIFLLPTYVTFVRKKNWLRQSPALEEINNQIAESLIKSYRI